MTDDASGELLSSADDLATWAEREGWLDDSVLFSTKVDAKRTARLRMGIRLEVEGTNTRFLEFELVAENATVTEPAPEGAFEVTRPVAEGDLFGFELVVEGRPLKILARTFRVVEHGETSRSIPQRR